MIPSIRNPRRFLLFLALIDFAVFIIAAIVISRGLQSGPAQTSALLVWFLIMLFVIGILWVFFRPLLKEQEIREKGVPARGVLLKYWETGTIVNGDPLVGLLFQVYKDEGEVYQAETKTILPRLSMDMLQQGVQVEVRYDPQHPEQVAFVGFKDGKYNGF